MLWYFNLAYGLCYTDSNGFEIRKREFNASAPDPIPGNFYPMIATSFINDTSFQFTAFTDRSHGVTSQQNGQLEMMLHRRLLQSDNLGPVCDDLTQLFDVTSWMMYEAAALSRHLRHRMDLLLQFRPVALFGLAGSDIARHWIDQYNTKWVPLGGKELPPNVHLLTLRAFGI